MTRSDHVLPLRCGHVMMFVFHFDVQTDNEKIRIICTQLLFQPITESVPQLWFIT